MRAAAVGHGLEEDGTLPGPAVCQRPTGGLQDGHHIVAVNLDGGDAIALGAGGH